MTIDVFKQFNFLDIIILIILFRICYVAVKSGLAVEIFKLLGVLSAIYLSLHYYTGISDLISKRYLLDNKLLEFITFAAFLILCISGYLIFFFLRCIFYRFMKMEAAPEVNKFGSLFLGLARTYLTIGLISYILVLSGLPYFSRSVKHSYLGSRAFAVCPQAYTWLWGNIFSKLSSADKANPAVGETRDNFQNK